MTTTRTYIKEWQEALQKEINHLKKFGGSTYSVSNGRLLSNHDKSFSYYFDSAFSLKIPVGSSIKLAWGGMKSNGKVLSSEGRGIILALEQNFGDLIPEAYLFHDPWELLEQLIERLDEIKKSKQKRLRIKRLMNPSLETNHPVEKIKGNVHELVLRSKYNHVTFVWGPPGTGKTYTLARTAANKYFHKKKVLILSHSNQAVDVLMSELTNFIKKKNRFIVGDVLRYGSNIGETLSEHREITTNLLIESQDPLLAQDRERLMEKRRGLKHDLAHSFSKRDSDHLLKLETQIAKLLEKVRKKEVQFVKDALIIGTTLAKAASDSAVYELNYDVVILDEASMAYVPQAAFAATLGKRVIICGDFKQLPPIASSRDSLVAQWLKEDVFHQAGVVEWLSKGKLHPQLFLLKEQRRMHPDIASFTNKYIYHSLVGNHESVYKRKNRITSLAPFKDRAAVLVDTSFTGLHCMSEKSTRSRLNLWQLLLSFQLIHESYLGGAKSIGYVTPYRAQANLMELLLEDIYEKERSLADIVAATVHRFQGSERDVMIFDTVDSAPQDRAGMLLTGKDSERLINVAITRTKGKFLHVSNRNYIEKHVFQGKTLRQLVDHQARHKQTVTTKEIGSWILNQHPKLRWIHAKKLEMVFRDLESARSSVILCLPYGSKLTEEWKKQLVNREDKCNLTILSDQDWGIADEWLDNSFSFPFVMIDEKILWLGFPIEGAREVMPPYVAVRLNSSKVCQFLLKQF